jgi:hypothetical protein
MWFWSARMTMSPMVEVIVGIGARFHRSGRVCSPVFSCDGFQRARAVFR